MPITPQNILRHELIGLKMRVYRSKNTQLRGSRGLVIDETKNTLVLEQKGNRRIIPKDVAVCRFWLPNGTIVEVDGKRLVGRPENRLKIKVKRW
jgi:ribonuclease P protein subunit POP4